ncbi:RES domain-containing protein [uncultured Salinisphaera sp.]|uniref:RES family NAD+ phosphorylase n=1 Tax=uncultured Salinisphaera sp. TaxID=359372 RepID=UPI0032B13C07|tara:strand:+ start:5737 stop:6204 length:468 start_codon:yes stop_codon:yes gene_type:complete
MRCWRIYHRRFADALSGEGARRYGGRWNPRGLPTLYLASTPSLAMAEKLVQAPMLSQANDFLAAEIEIDARHLPLFTAADLPERWNAEPFTSATPAFGAKQFLELGRLGFRVPSVVVPLEYNIVIHTAHTDFSRFVQCRRDGLPFPFDRRLLRDD